MIKNSQLLSKAAITSSSFAQRVGLSTEDADRFIDYIIDASFLKNNARIERMKGNTKKLVRLGIGEEVLRPGTYGTSGDGFTDISTTAITLTSKSMKAVVPLADDALMDNIEGEAFADHLMRVVANQIGNQLEYAYLMGQDVGASITKNHIWEQIDGWYPRAIGGGQIIDCSSLSDRYVSADKLSRAIKALDSKYRGNRTNLRFIMSDDLYQDFVDVLGNRTTPLGDEAITGDSLLSFGKIKIAPCSLLPSNLPVRVTSGGSTTLSQNATAGATTISVASNANFDADDFITIGSGATCEVRKVTAKDTGTLDLDTALTYAHTSGQAVVECTLDGTYILLCDCNNLILGIQQDIQIETERRATEGVTYFVVTIRCDCALENPEAVVVLNNMKVK